MGCLKLPIEAFFRKAIPGQVDISGYAIPEAKVRIQKGTGKPTSPVRTNGYFFQQYSFDNSASPAEETFKVYAVKNESTKDIVSTQTLNVFLPKTPELFTYDPDGNLLSDGRFTYTWNAENRLITIMETGKQKLDFSYDYMGRRTEKKVYSWDGSAWTLSSSLKFAYDGWNCIAALDGSTNVVLKTYVWGEDLSGSLQGAGGVGGLLAETNSSGTFFPAYDANGNIVAYVDTDGKIAAAYEYDAFGRLIGKSGPLADEFSFRFSTKYFDKETGNYYYGYRFYSPELKRWLSRDPIDENGGYNLYGFVSNNPINRFDKLGKLSFPTISLDGLTDIADSAMKFVQVAGGLPFSIASGDAFNGFQDVSSFEQCQCCDFLITINGIWNTRDDATNVLTTSYKEIYGQNANPNSCALGIANTTGALINLATGSNAIDRTAAFASGGFRDLIQIVGDELGTVNNVSMSVAKAINKAQEVGERNQKNGGCSGGIKIRVIAHNQGTMVFKQSISFIDSKAKKNIHYQGFGSEAFIPGDRYGFKARNVRNADVDWGILGKADLVPFMGNYITPRAITRQFSNDAGWVRGTGTGHLWSEYYSQIDKNF